MPSPRHPDTTQRIRRGTFDNVHVLEAAIESYLTHHNGHCKPFVWTATADAIVDKIKRFCQRTAGTDDPGLTQAFSETRH